MTRQHDNEALTALWRQEPIKKIAEDLSRRRCQRDNTTAYDHNDSLESGSDGGAFLPNATDRTAIVSNVDLPRELRPASKGVDRFDFTLNEYFIPYRQPPPWSSVDGLDGDLQSAVSCIDVPNPTTSKYSQSIDHNSLSARTSMIFRKRLFQTSDGPIKTSPMSQTLRYRSSCYSPAPGKSLVIGRPATASSIFDPAPSFRHDAIIGPSAAQLYPHPFSPNQANTSPAVGSSIGEHWGKTELMVLPYQMVRQFIEKFFCGQNASFSIVRQDHFLHGFMAGDKQYCSSALIRMICCLGCRNIAGHGADQSYCAGLGDRLFLEALQVIGSPESSDFDFPNGQALLLMGLHQLAAGEYDEAQRLTDQGVQRLYLVHRRTDKAKTFGTLGTMEATTLLGAVCFARMLRLSIGHIQCSRLGFQVHDLPMLIWRKGLAEVDANVEQLLSLPGLVGVSHVDQDVMGMQSIIFQLTDWVYIFASRVQTTVGDALPQPLLDTYHACLSWYASTFVRNDMEKVSEPFVHLYYHFCLLTLFRPFCHVNSKDVSPLNICLESVDSILTLKNVCGQFEGFNILDFVTIFVYAAAQAERCIIAGQSAVENIDGSGQAQGISSKTEISGGMLSELTGVKETARRP